MRENAETGRCVGSDYIAAADEIDRLRADLETAERALDAQTDFRAKIDRLRAENDWLRGEGSVENYEEMRRLRAENETLKADAERFCALFSHIDKSGESPWSAIESVKYGERIDAGEPLIDVIREAIDKHLRGEGE